MAAVPPPSYNEAFADRGFSVVISPPSNEAPPAYNDLFPGLRDVREKVQRVRETEEGQSAAGRVAVPVAVCDLLCKSVFCGCVYLILAVLPIAMIVIGSVFRHDCQVQTSIPTFLIVFGVCSLIQICCGLMKMIFCRVKEDDDEATRKRKKGSNFGEGFLTAFLIIWVIVGSFWVFNAWNLWNAAEKPSCPSSNDYCCHPVLMYFSFSVLIIVYGLVVLACFCFFCCVSCVNRIIAKIETIG